MIEAIACGIGLFYLNVDIILVGRRIVQKFQFCFDSFFSIVVSDFLVEHSHPHEREVRKGFLKICRLLNHLHVMPDRIEFIDLDVGRGDVGKRI